MNQVLEFFQKLFDTADWPPRWHCGNWTEFHGWLYIISDLLIWSAYFAIPIFILRFITRKTNLQFTRTYFLFAAFILACGSTHLLDAVTFWFPAYRLNALVRLITGVISWVTVFHLVKLLPTATSLRTNAELESEIDQRKNAEEQLRLSNHMLNEAQELARMGSWQWDMKKDVVEWSDNLYHLYGIEKNQPLNYETIIQLIHPDDREMVDGNLKKAIAEKRYDSFTYRILGQDDQVKILQARGQVIVENDQPISMVGTVQDITEQQQAQREILEKTKDLESLNEELQRFAYVASHDLQEPLRKILTFSSMLKKETSVTNEKGNMYLQKIEQASMRMQALIEDILQFSKVKSNSDAFEACDLNEVLNQVLSDTEVAIIQSGAQVQIDQLPVIDAIPSQMGQLFQNLISNAIKFRKEDVAPVVRLTCQVINGQQLAARLEGKNILALKPNHGWEREQFVLLQLTDNGVGFDNSYAEKIFEIFQRLHGKSVSGTGIGLAICKKIVDNHHGYIEAEGKPNEGARFTIVLPFSQQNLMLR